MSYSPFTPPLPWHVYSKKLAQKIDNPRHIGFFSYEEAKERGMRLAVGKEGSHANIVHIYLLVDESDGVIADAKFQARGPSALIGASEAMCELLMRKTYDQAMRLTAELIDKQVRDKTSISAFPDQAFTYLNSVIDAVGKAAEQCLDIVFEEQYVPTPLPPQDLSSGILYPDFPYLSKDKKIAVIEQVIASDIRPYIELDAGGIEVLNLTEEHEVIIAYQGACTSCYSATGTTLHAIQEILRAKVYSPLTVIPDSSFLKF